MDEGQLYMRPRNLSRSDERHPTGTELEFIKEQIGALPTRRELIRFGVWVALGLCMLALVGRRMWDRYSSSCSLN
jgi:hypothetical protein